MSEYFERAQEAHRAAFALVTAALADPEDAPIAELLAAYAADADNPGQRLGDIAHALVWNAASALLTHAGGINEALVLVRQAAYTQEMKKEGNDE